MAEQRRDMTVDHFAAPPARRIGALGLVLGMRRNGVLLVEKDTRGGPARWGLVGGCVGAGENVAAACVRRVRQEAGLAVYAGPLLAVHHMPADGPSAEGLNFVFECGRVDEKAAIRLGPGLASYAFVPVGELDRWVTPYTSARIRHALVQRARLTTDTRSAYLSG